MNHSQVKTARNRVGLPFGFFGGPVLWALQLIIGYGLVTVARNIGSKWPVLLEIAISGLIVLLASILAFSAWKSMTRDSLLREVDVQQESSNFWAVSGFVVSLLFFLAILTTFVAAFFLSPLPIITMPLP
jgi:hypothetical protein